jgi:TRAP-type mannitol/chloroaromatic compound transport system permease small subunit
MSSPRTPSTLFYRFFAWSVVMTTFAFVFNVYLTHWRGWPGAAGILGAGGAFAWTQTALYVLAVVGSAAFVVSRAARSLRDDGHAISEISAFVVRAAFWTIVLVGIADAVISFLRVEQLLPHLVGLEMEQAIARNSFRGPAVHLPLTILAVIIAYFRRSLDVIWLALLVVLAELAIVITRFVFSYEQSFMGDLVRFWYAGLFMFASAYTLIEDGHVRVDVLYSGFTAETKGLVNALGSLLLGITLCAVILVFGMASKASVITSPMVSLEVTQSGFGMYVKYMMAGFLGVFAVSMMLQFASYLLEGIADRRGEPGRHEVDHATIY